MKSNEKCSVGRRRRRRIRRRRKRRRMRRIRRRRWGEICFFVWFLNALVNY